MLNLLRCLRSSIKNLCFINLLALFLIGCKSNSDIPKIHNGILDLSTYNFNSSKSIKLSGHWDFTWSNVPYSELKDIKPHENRTDSILVPSRWSDIQNLEEGLAFGRLKMRVLLAKNESISIFFPPDLVGYSFYVNGKKVTSIGVDKSKSAPDTFYEISQSKIQSTTGSVELVWEITNFGDVYGGPMKAPDIGKSETIKAHAWWIDIINTGLVSIFFIIACYHLMLWWARKTDHASFYFSLICYLLFIKELNESTILQRHFYQTDSYELHLKMIFSGGIMIFALFANYVRILFPIEFSKSVIKKITIGTLLTICLFITTPASVYTPLLAIMQVFYTIITIWSIYVIVHVVRKKRDNSKEIFIAILILFICGIHDALLTYKIIHTEAYMVKFGMLFFILIQSWILAVRVAKDHNRIKHLSKNLQQEVDEQTEILKSQKKELEETYQQLKTTDEHKTIFFQNITHEFRTPLTLILGPVQDMISNESDRLNPKLVNNLKGVQQQANQLLELINQLLELAKLDANGIPFSPTPLDLVPFLQNTTVLFKSWEMEKNIDLILCSDVDEFIADVDAEKLKRILYNLLSNAFKFSNCNGQIKLQLITETNENTYLIKVIDNGIGIPQEEQKKIFDRFYQFDESITREYEGTGIGLSLVKKQVELHKGTITVQSEVNKGTTFTIVFSQTVSISPNEKTSQFNSSKSDLTMRTMPHVVAESNELRPISYHREEEEINLENQNHNIDLPTVLIAEDNKEMRAYIVSILEDEYKTYEASNGEEAYQLILEVIPDLIISDIMMPKLDGISLCRELKNDERTNHIPVIILTARSSDGEKIKSLSNGADDHLVKPFSSEILKFRIQYLITSRKKLSEIFAERIIFEPANIITENANETFIKKLQKFVEMNLENENFGVPELSAKMNLSSPSLYRKLKQIAQLSPGDYIRKMKLLHASQLLKKTKHHGLSVSDIAIKCGFKSLSHFSHSFKKQYDMTPKAYALKHSKFLPEETMDSIASID